MKRSKSKNIVSCPDLQHWQCAEEGNSERANITNAVY